MSKDILDRYCEDPAYYVKIQKIKLAITIIGLVIVGLSWLI